LAGADGQIPLEVAVGAFLEDKERDKRGFVVLPDRIAGGLVGAAGKLVGAVDTLTDGFGGLEALENSVEDETDFRLRPAAWKIDGEEREEESGVSQSEKMGYRISDMGEGHRQLV
jgi:hypothetical protein